MRSAADGRTLVWRRRRFAAVFIALFASIAVLPVLPWAMGILGDVQHSYTATVPDENKGAYLVTDDGVMQLYSWDVEPTDFPPDAPVLEASRVHGLVLVQRAFDDVDAHVLYHIDRGHRVPWAGSAASPRHLELEWEGDLAPGRYLLVVPSDSSFGGVHRHYFRIADPEEAP